MFWKVRKTIIPCEILLFLPVPLSPMCIELISAVKHLKRSEVVPRGLFQGFLKIRKSKKTIQDIQLSKDVITTIPAPHLKKKSEIKETN